jgi:hypothetical protein
MNFVRSLVSLLANVVDPTAAIRWNVATVRQMLDVREESLTSLRTLYDGNIHKELAACEHSCSMSARRFRRTCLLVERLDVCGQARYRIASRDPWNLLSVNEDGGFVALWADMHRSNNRGDVVRVPPTVGADSVAAVSAHE